MIRKMPKVPEPPVAEGVAGARTRLAQVLMVLRSPDPPGAYSAIAEDRELVDLLVGWPDPKRPELWDQLVTKLQQLAEAQRCLRCGTCCRVSSPTLYEEDLEAVRSGQIARNRLFTIRKGELVRSARLEETFILEEDLIKLKERPQGGCLLLDDHLCSDYDHRPLQCRHLECWSGRNAGDLEDRPRLTRQQVFEDDEVGLQLIEEYDSALPAGALHQRLEAAREGDQEATFEALAYLERDGRLRAAITERYGYSPRELELLLGREGIELVRAHGLVINFEDKESPAFVPR